MKNKKILFVLTALGMGGAENQVCSLADKLSQKGYRITIISILDGEIKIRPKNNNIEIICLNMKKNIFSFFISMMKLKKIIKKEQPDIVHSHMVHANIFSRLLRIFIKIPVLICTAHNKNEGGKLRMFLYRITDRLATISTNVSQEAVDAFIEKKATKLGRMIPIYNGIDTNVFFYDNINREKIRDEMDLDNENPLILAVGRLTEAKDYPNLLHAFANLNSPKKPRLVIIGDGEEKEKLQQLADSLNISEYVIWLGIRHDVHEWMSACDLFVLSSAWEGFGLVVAEAMACECLVIGTDSGGVGEVIDKYGLVIPPKDTLALTSAITQYLALSNHEKNVLGLQARKHIIDTFSLEKISQEWLNLYTRLLKKYE